MGKWADLMSDITEKDKEMSDEVSKMYGTAIPIEVKLSLANNRALCALIVLRQVLEHLDKQEFKEK